MRNSSRQNAATADDRDFDARGTGPRTLATALLRAFLRRPADSLGMLALTVTVGAILGNALFFQRGPHPAPYAPGPAKTQRSVPAETTGSLVAPAKVRLAAAETGNPSVPLPVSAPARTRAQLISDLQRELAQRGYYDGAIDGLHGPKMDAAIREFEQGAGIKPTGEPSETLLRAVQKTAAKPAARNAASARQSTGPSATRIAAVQRALADFGYGQLRPSGVLDAGTKAAIEKFERDRKLPVTGQISDRLTRDLAAVTGRPLD